MDPLALKVAARFAKRAREGEIAHNPVIENMANSDFVSEKKTEDDTHPQHEVDEDGHSRATEPEPQKVIPNAK
jgi:hypothetical protein